MAGDVFDLARFVDAQSPVMAAVRGELAAGAKRSHWMWFVFPQHRALGRSATAQHYGLTGVEEAAAYWHHPVLGPRLRECCALLLAACLQFRDDLVHDRFDLPGLPLILNGAIDQGCHVLLPLLPVGITLPLTGHPMMRVGRTTSQGQHGNESENISLNALHDTLQ